MAVGYRSGTTDDDSGSAAKPSGLAVGDIMVGVFQYEANGSPGTSVLSGWTLLVNDYYASQNLAMRIIAKKADAADVAASSFGISTGSANIAGGYCTTLLAFSGAGAVTDIVVSSVTQQSASNTVISTPSVTTTNSDAIVLRVVGAFWERTDTISGATRRTAVTWYTDGVYNGAAAIAFTEAGPTPAGAAGAKNASYSSGNAFARQAVALAIQAASSSVYDETGSGGSQAASTAIYGVTFTALADDGGTLSGEGNVSQVCNVESEAGGAAGGDGAVQVLASVTATGGSVLSGLGSVTSVTNFGASGGAVLSGQGFIGGATYLEVVTGGIRAGGTVRIKGLTMIDEDFRTFLIDRLGDLWDEPGKIQEGHNEQSTEYPRIWYQRRSSNEVMFFSGPSGLITTSFDVEAISDDLNEAQQLARGIKTAINGYRGEVGESNAQLVEYADHSDEYIPSGIGDDEGAHVASIDVTVIHNS